MRIIRAINFGSAPPREAAVCAEKAAIRALELDSALSEAVTALASISFSYFWNWTASAEHFAKAIDCDPYSAAAHQRFSLFLMAMNRVEESLSEIHLARELNSVSISINFSLGRRLYMARQFDRCIEQLENTLEMDPDYELARCVLGQAYEQRGEYAQAIDELEKAAATAPNSLLVAAWLGRVCGIAGRTGTAKRILRRLVAESKRRYVSPFFFALVHSGVGEIDATLDCLEKAQCERASPLAFIQVDPVFDGLRLNRRFQELEKRMELPN